MLSTGMPLTHDSSYFAHKKAEILASLSRPAEVYTDASPKGSIDAPIAHLIDEINSYDGLVTTSSCSGRISVFVEGEKGPKDSGGKWLFVSHELVTCPDGSSNEQAHQTLHLTGSEAPGWYSLFSLSPLDDQGTRTYRTSSRRFVHFKFEPLILHILCTNPAKAQSLLSCAQQAGFRESGASSMPSSAVSGQAKSDTTLNVAIRTTGLAFDNIVGYHDRDESGSEIYTSTVSESHLDMLVHISNQKFGTNSERTSRLQHLLRKSFANTPEDFAQQRRPDTWEDAEVRRLRMREEGLKRQQEIKGSALNVEKE